MMFITSLEMYYSAHTLKNTFPGLKNWYNSLNPESMSMSAILVV